jgi:N6-L-threonylcarbamoyladenine synthase
VRPSQEAKIGSRARIGKNDKSSVYWYFMIILGIETSCDETAINIIETSGTFPDNFNIEIKSNIVLSQIQIHKQYGGVFPTLAKREHSKNLVPVFIQALKEADLFSEKKEPVNFPAIEKILEREPEMLEKFKLEITKIEKPKIDFICVTKGPGLEPALWTGINFAKALEEFWQIPTLSINHMEGHVIISLLNRDEKLPLNNFQLSKPEFPALSLLVSGGHTELILIKKWFDYEKIGATKDDAVGEAFDKVARILGLPYPGGPEISKLAEKWRNSEQKGLGIKLPRPMINSKDLNFSFSGLKTAVLYIVQKIENLNEEIKAEISAEFENAVVETIIRKIKDAIEKFDTKSLILGGGVAANKTLRESLKKLAVEEDCKIFIPEISHSTDNALMISIAGACRLEKNPSIKDNLESKADGNWSIDKI